MQAATTSPASPSHSSTVQGQKVSSPTTETSPATPATADTEQQQHNNTTTLLNNLANTKEKTPMCLINELARFNKAGLFSQNLLYVRNEVDIFHSIMVYPIFYVLIL
jgi:hypothetical protein